MKGKRLNKRKGRMGKEGGIKGKGRGEEEDGELKRKGNKEDKKRGMKIEREEGKQK